MLKTLGITKLAIPRKEGVEAGDSGRSELDSKNEVGDGEVDGNEVKDNEVAKKKNLWKIWKTSKSKMTIRYLDIFTLKTRLAFIGLR